MSGEAPVPGSEGVEQPITMNQYYARHADALAQEHTDAFLKYREAAKAKSSNLNQAERNLTEVEDRMRKKADEARRDLGEPEAS